MIPALVGCFYLGLAAGWWTHARIAPAVADAANAARDTPAAPPSQSTPATPPPTRVDRPIGTAGSTKPVLPPVERSDAVADPIRELRNRHLQLPIDGIDVARLKGQFADARDGGRRGHEAVDMLSPRGTAVRAVEDGTIEKLFTSKAGGLTIYQFEPSGRFCYYYAHLDRYAPGLRDKQSVRRGDLIGFVGTTGNAPADTPHLHFAIFELNAARRWWQGRPLDPWRVFNDLE